MDKEVKKSLTKLGLLSYLIVIMVMVLFAFMVVNALIAYKENIQIRPVFECAWIVIDDEWDDEMILSEEEIPKANAVAKLYRLIGYKDEAYRLEIIADYPILPDLIESNSGGSTGNHAWIKEEYAPYISEVVLDNRLTNIPAGAFYGLIKLESINIPAEVTTISKNAFYGCKSLNNVVMNGKLTEIGEGSFANCTNLLKIIIPETVEKIDSFAFQNCSNLMEIILSNNLTEVKDYTFSECTTLEKVYIGSKVTKLGKHAFSACSNLREIEFSDESILNEISECAFQECASLEEIVLPESVNQVRGFAFGKCNNLKKVEFLSDSLFIQSNPFNESENIEEVRINAESELRLEKFDFSELPEGCTVYVLNDGIKKSIENVMTNKDKININVL